MKIIKIALTGFLALLSAQSPAQEIGKDSISLTIYQNNFGIAHENRNIELEAGISEIFIDDLPRDLVPETIYAEFDGSVLAQRYRRGEMYSPAGVYQQLEGEEIRLISESGELVEGIVRSSRQGQIWLEDSDGQFIFIQNVYSYRLITDQPRIMHSGAGVYWTVESESAGSRDVSLFYQVNNISWKTDYLLIIDEDESFMNLEARATIVNHSGSDYRDARIRLVAGDMNVEKGHRPMQAYDSARMQMQATMESSGISPESLFEYHVFELPNPASLADMEQRQVPLHTAEGIEAETFYTYRAGSFGQVRGSNNQVHAELRLENNEEYKLGTPLPAGLVKIFQKNNGLTEFIGEDRIDHIPVEEEFVISAGRAFDVTVEEKQISLNRISDRVTEEERNIVIRNQKDEEISVEVELRLNQNDELISSSVEGRQEEARRFVFDVPVDAASEAVLNVQLRRGN